MKFKSLIAIAFICVASLSLGVIAVKAEDGSSSSSSSIKTNLGNRFEDRDVRNTMLGQKQEDRRELRASTTGEVKQIRQEFRDDRKDLRASTTAQIKDIREEERERIQKFRASTTMIFKAMKDDKHDLIKKMRINTFEMRKTALIKELRMSLSTMNSIRAKIDTRIATAETNGRNMTDAKAKMVIAINKLDLAKTAVDALDAYKYSTTTSATASTTAEIDIEKPRKVGDTAIKAVKDARDALKDVVGAVAKSMGLGIRPNATTTSPTPATIATSTTTN